MADEEPATGKERRRHPRFACDGWAEVVAFRPDLLFRGEVKDISLTGCFIATRARLNLRRFAEMELRFSANGERLSSLARVMEVIQAGVWAWSLCPAIPAWTRVFTSCSSA